MYRQILSKIIFRRVVLDPYKGKEENNILLIWALFS